MYFAQKTELIALTVQELLFEWWHFTILFTILTKLKRPCTTLGPLERTPEIINIFGFMKTAKLNPV